MKTLVMVVIALVFVNSTSQIHAQSGWFQLNSGTDKYMNCILFINENTGYIGADAGQFLITTNAGMNWVISFTGIADSYLLDMHFLNVSTGYIAGAGLGIFKTTNGGLNLQNISSGAPSRIFFRSQDTGYYSTKYFGIFKTTNGGVNWFNVKPNYRQLEGKVLFFNNNTGFVTGQGRIYKTTNGAISWDSITIVNESTYTFDLQFVNNTTGYLCGYINTGGLYKTTNSGNNWVPVYIGSWLDDLHFVNENTGFAINYNNLFIKTTNGGINWTGYSDTSFATPTDIYFTNPLTGYIITRWGRILKTTNGGAIGIHQISTEIPLSFELSQNYPNPFNPETNIKFAVPKTSRVKISVYDVLGKEIEVLVNENLNPGIYKVDWNASAYPSGIYLYVITAGEFTQTKKMVLVK